MFTHSDDILKGKLSQRPRSIGGAFLLKIKNRGCCLFNNRDCFVDNSVVFYFSKMIRVRRSEPPWPRAIEIDDCAALHPSFSISPSFVLIALRSFSSSVLVGDPKNPPTQTISALCFILSPFLRSISFNYFLKYNISV